MVRSKQHRLVLILASGICAALAFSAGLAAYGIRHRASGSTYGGAGTAESSIFWEAWVTVEEHLYGPVPSAQRRTYGALRMSLQLLDGRTTFVEPAARELEQDRLRGAYGGIGVSIWRDEEGQLLLDPYPGSPAEKAGIHSGDVLLAVDGIPVTESTAKVEVEAEFHGQVGTPLTLSISNQLTPAREVTITRQFIQRPSVRWHMATPEFGYIRFDSFTQTTERELAVALDALRSSGATGLVLDLRGNRGGLLEAATAAVDRFLDKNTVVLYEARRGRERRIRARRGQDVDLPLVVLIDGETASAAEIVAAALQDHGRAPLIGQTSRGKGSVQEIYELSDGSSLHITAALWLTPDRHRIDGKGLTPDILALDDDAPGDGQLERAVAYLESGS